MTARVLLGHHWRRHRVILAVLAGGMFVFEFLITRLAPDPSRTQVFESILQLLPGPLVDLLGSEFTANFNTRGMLGFGYVHPFTLVMMSVWVARISAGALAGEIGTGTMDLLAARPVPRGHMVKAALIALLAGLAIIIAAGWMGTAVGLWTRPALAIAPWPYLSVAVGCWLLFAAFAGAALVIAALQRQGGPAIGVTSGLIAVSFALNFVARAWQPLQWSRPLSLFMYYEPERLLVTGVLTVHVLVLAVVAAVLAALAFPLFARRDL